MNSPSGKISKQRRQAMSRLPRGCCGTLHYMAECRGVTKEAKPARRQMHVDGVSNHVRRYSPAS